MNRASPPQTFSAPGAVRATMLSGAPIGSSEPGVGRRELVVARGVAAHDPRGGGAAAGRDVGQRLDELLRLGRRGQREPVGRASRTPCRPSNVNGCGARLLTTMRTSKNSFSQRASPGMTSQMIIGWPPTVRTVG